MPIRQGLVFAALLLLSCVSFGERAEPERYAGLNCELLADLSQSYAQSPADLIAAGQDGLMGVQSTETGKVFRRDRRIDADRRRDARSVALARREKSC